MLGLFRKKWDLDEVKAAAERTGYTISEESYLRAIVQEIVQFARAKLGEHADDIKRRVEGNWRVEWEVAILSASIGDTLGATLLEERRNGEEMREYWRGGILYQMECNLGHRQGEDRLALDLTDLSERKVVGQLDLLDQINEYVGDENQKTGLSMTRFGLNLGGAVGGREGGLLNLIGPALGVTVVGEGVNQVVHRLLKP